MTNVLYCDKRDCVFHKRNEYEEDYDALDECRLDHIKIVNGKCIDYRGIITVKDRQDMRKLNTLVRCGECKHRDPEDKKCDCGMFERQGCIFPVDDDYFCKYGERRTDDY